jgi:hypothetical protein
VIIGLPNRASGCPLSCEAAPKPRILADDVLMYVGTYGTSCVLVCRRVRPMRVVMTDDGLQVYNTAFTVSGIYEMFLAGFLVFIQLSDT